MKIEGGELGVLEEIEVCPSHQPRGKRPSLFASLNYPERSFSGPRLLWPRGRGARLLGPGAAAPLCRGCSSEPEEHHTHRGGEAGPIFEVFL